MTEADFWSSFDEMAGGALGAIFDAMSSVLRGLPESSLCVLPRMADYAKRSMAAVRSFGIESGDFASAYNANIKASRDCLLDISTFGRALVDIAETSGFEGTPRELLATILRLPTKQYDMRSLPHENDVRKQMRRLAPVMRSRGVVLHTELPRTNRARLVAVSKSDSYDGCDTAK
jgi:hypothetical protein